MCGEMAFLVSVQITEKYEVCFMGYKNLFVLYHLGRFQLLPVPVFYHAETNKRDLRGTFSESSYSIVDTCYINSNLGSKSLELP